MIKMKLKDNDGHGYWLYDDGQLVLALKEQPPVGIQHVTKGWLKKGVLDLRNLHWNYRLNCWEVIRFPLIKTVSFGIDMLHVASLDGDRKKREGYVHPKFLTSRVKGSKKPYEQSTGYAKFLKLYPADLCDTQQVAEELWKQLEEKFGRVGCG